MTELPPLTKCKVDKRGRHELGAILPGEDDGDATLYCQRCGVVRRFAVSGSLHVERLDDLDADGIYRAVSQAAKDRTAL